MIIEYTLDAAFLDEKGAHSYLKERLQFPEYYGFNQDALYDCLTDMYDVIITIKNTDKAPEYFEKLRDVFEDASENNEGLEVIFL